MGKPWAGKAKEDPSLGTRCIFPSISLLHTFYFTGGEPQDEKILHSEFRTKPSMDIEINSPGKRKTIYQKDGVSGKWFPVGQENFNFRGKRWPGV